MVYINGFKFYDTPGSCGTCTFFMNGATEMFPGSEYGECIQWGERHRRTTSPGAKCKKMFREAFKFPDGSDLTIVRKERPGQDEDD
jgi:hypothetical protein